MFTTALLLASLGADPLPGKTHSTHKSESRGFSWSWSSGTPMPNLPMPEFPGPLPVMPQGWPKIPGFPDLPVIDPFEGMPVKDGFSFQSSAASTDVRRHGDRFTARWSDGRESVEVVGRVTDAGTMAETVTVKMPSKKAESYTPAEVPTAYKSIMRKLMARVE